MKPYYDHAGITIYHGDCRDIVPQLGRFDLLLTDPPYGRNALDGSRTARIYGINRSDNWDCYRPSSDLLQTLFKMTDNQIVWGLNYFISDLKDTKCFIVWDKPSMSGIHTMSFGEIAWTSFDYPAKKITMESEKVNRAHPTQKPIGLISVCIGIAEKNCACQTIFDPFMGSGTTLRAAKDLNRKAVGIEINEQYCEIAANRMSQEVLAL